MATEINWTVEVYDLETGKHFTRECTPDELASYEELASQVAPSGDEQNAPSSDTPSDPS